MLAKHKFQGGCHFFHIADYIWLVVRPSEFQFRDVQEHFGCCGLLRNIIVGVVVENTFL